MSCKWGLSLSITATLGSYIQHSLNSISCMLALLHGMVPTTSGWGQLHGTLWHCSTSCAPSGYTTFLVLSACILQQILSRDQLSKVPCSEICLFPVLQLDFSCISNVFHTYSQPQSPVIGESRLKTVASRKWIKHRFSLFSGCQQ